MKKEENKNLEYLSRVYKELPTERKEDLLHTARQLLKIQDNNTFPVPNDNSVPPNE